MFTHASRRRGVIAAATLGLIATPLAVLATATPAQAAPSTGLVISEVYGGGGNAGATFNNDFVELLQPDRRAPSRRRHVGPVPLAPPATPRTVTQPDRVGPGERLLPRRRRPPATTGSRAADARRRPASPPCPARNGGRSSSRPTTTAVTASGNLAGRRPANVDRHGRLRHERHHLRDGQHRDGARPTATSAQRAATGADTDANNRRLHASSTPTPTNRATASSPRLAATNPGNKTATTNQAITAVHPRRDRRHLALHLERTGLPDRPDRHQRRRHQRHPDRRRHLQRDRHGDRLGHAHAGDRPRRPSPSPSPTRARR